MRGGVKTQDPGTVGILGVANESSDSTVSTERKGEETGTCWR